MTDTIQQLHEIPDLAAEAFATWNAPNPSTRPERVTPTTGSRPPTDLAVLDALRPDPDGEGRSLRGVLAQAVRAVWEDARMEAAHVPDLPEATWAGDCDWLRRTYAFWSGDRWLVEFVGEQVAEVHRGLSALCRVPKPPIYACPTCDGRMEPIPGGHMLACKEGHEHPADLERQWRRRPPLPASMIEQVMGVRANTLAQWKRRRKIRPRMGDDGQDLFYPWDVLLLKHPDIAEAFAARDKAG